MLSAQAIADVESFQAGFFERNPVIRFRAFHAKAAALLAEGRPLEALAVMRKELTPLTSTQPQLVPALNRLVQVGRIRFALQLCGGLGS